MARKASTHRQFFGLGESDRAEPGESDRIHRNNRGSSASAAAPRQRESFPRKQNPNTVDSFDDVTGPWARVLAAHAMRPNSAFSRLPDAQKLLRGGHFHTSRSPLPPLQARPLSASPGLFRTDSSSGSRQAPGGGPAPLSSAPSSSTSSQLAAERSTASSEARSVQSESSGTEPAALALLPAALRPQSALRPASGDGGRPSSRDGLLPGVPPLRRNSGRASPLPMSTPPLAPPARSVSRLSSVSSADRWGDGGAGNPNLNPAEKTPPPPSGVVRLDDLGRSRAALAELLDHARRFESAHLPDGSAEPPKRRSTNGRLGSAKPVQETSTPPVAAPMPKPPARAPSGQVDAYGLPLTPPMEPESPLWDAPQKRPGRTIAPPATLEAEPSMQSELGSDDDGSELTPLSEGLSGSPSPRASPGSLGSHRAAAHGGSERAPLKATSFSSIGTGAGGGAEAAPAPPRSWASETAARATRLSPAAGGSPLPASPASPTPAVKSPQLATLTQADEETETESVRLIRLRREALSKLREGVADDLEDLSFCSSSGSSSESEGETHAQRRPGSAALQRSAMRPPSGRHPPGELGSPTAAAASAAGSPSGAARAREKRPPRPHPPVFVYQRDADLAAAGPGSQGAALLRAASANRRRHRPKTRQSRRAAQAADRVRASGGSSVNLEWITAGPAAALEALGPLWALRGGAASGGSSGAGSSGGEFGAEASGGGSGGTPRSPMAPDGLEQAGARILAAIRQFRRGGHELTFREALRVLSLFGATVSKERRRAVPPADRVCVQALALLAPFAGDPRTLVSIACCLHPEEQIELGRRLGWRRLFDPSRPAGLRYSLLLSDPDDCAVALKLTKLAWCMSGVRHFVDMQLGPQTLSEASVRQVWGELLAASAKGGKGVKLEGGLQFTFSCDAATLAAGAARVIQAHYRGMHVRRMMKDDSWPVLRMKLEQETVARDRMLHLSQMMDRDKAALPQPQREDSLSFF